MNITIDETKEPKQGEEKQKSPRFKVIQDKDGKQAVIVEREDGTQEKMGAFENPFADNLSEDDKNLMAGALSNILNMARIGAAEKGKEAVIDDALKDALSFANIHNAAMDGNTKDMINAVLGAKLPPLEGIKEAGELMKGFADSLRSTLAEEVFNDLEMTLAAQKKLIDETMEPVQKQIASSMEMMKEYTKGISEIQEELRKLYEENPVYFMALEELAKLKEEPEYSGIDENELSIEYEDEEHNIIADTLQNRAVEIAWSRAEERYKQEKQEKQDEQEEHGKQPIPQIKRKDSPTTVIPIDKVNNTIWKMVERAAINGQYEFDFVTGKPAKKGQRTIEPLVMYSLDFGKIEETAPEMASIVKHLTPYDKRVLVAAAALYNSGNDYFTITDVYHKMGNAKDKRPNKNDFEKINNSLTKQRFAILKMNNLDEQKAGYKYPKFNYDGPLLSFERVTAEIDGQPIESAIHLFREPALVTFARDRKQITTVKNEVLESPVSKTEQNLQIDDYLIEQISAMKRDPKFNRKILFNTLFKACNVKGKNPARTKETIENYLRHYKRTAFIKDYTFEKEFVTITP